MKAPELQEPKVATDQAEAEVNAWLDYKKITPAQREGYKESIETLKNAIADGTIVIREDKSIVHTLKFPVGVDDAIKQVVYKPRLKLREIQKAVTGIKATDGDGRLTAYVAELTGNPRAIIGEFDTADWSIAQSIVVFFA